MKRVWGCIDTGFQWPGTPESGRSVAGVSNVTAANTLVNGYLELGRTDYGTVEVRRLVGGQGEAPGVALRGTPLCQKSLLLVCRFSQLLTLVVKHRTWSQGRQGGCTGNSLFVFLLAALLL